MPSGLLFQRHARAIYNYCFRRVGSWAAAEDLVSIVFLEAWRRAKQAAADRERAPLALRDRHERRSEPPSRRATLRSGAEARSAARPSASFVDNSDARIDDEKLMAPRARAARPSSPPRAGCLRALRLVRAQLRGRCSRPAGSCWNSALTPLSRARAACGNSTPRPGHEEAKMQIVEKAAKP